MHPFLPTHPILAFRNLSCGFLDVIRSRFLRFSSILPVFFSKKSYLGDDAPSILCCWLWLPIKFIWLRRSAVQSRFFIPFTVNKHPPLKNTVIQYLLKACKKWLTFDHSLGQKWWICRENLLFVFVFQENCKKTWGEVQIQLLSKHTIHKNSSNVFFSFLWISIGLEKREQYTRRLKPIMQKLHLWSHLSSTTGNLCPETCHETL